MIETERLILRQWREEDREPFSALNADPEVRRHFPSVLTRDQSDSEMDRIVARLAQDGTTFWAVERKSDAAFLGFSGVLRTDAGLPFDCDPEIGWRFSRDAWGQGYATESARAAFAFAVERLKPKRVVSFTATTNLKSQAVMNRIGMVRRGDLDFDHPRVAEGDPLRRHVVWVWEACAPA